MSFINHGTPSFTAKQHTVTIVMMRIITETAVTAGVATIPEITTTTEVTTITEIAIITEITTIALTRFGVIQTVAMATDTGTRNPCVVAGRVQIVAGM
jgi:hypothetical protein